MSELWAAIARSAAGDVTADVDGGVRQAFVFAKKFPGFMGHFPGYSVLPGVVQMMAAALVASHGLDAVREIRGVKSARFLTPISPGMTVTVHVHPQGPDAAEIRVMAQDVPAAAFTLVFEKIP